MNLGELASQLIKANSYLELKGRLSSPSQRKSVMSQDLKNPPQSFEVTAANLRTKGGRVNKQQLHGGSVMQDNFKVGEGVSVVRSSLNSTLDLPFIKKPVRIKDHQSRTRRASNFEGMSQSHYHQQQQTTSNYPHVQDPAATISNMYGNHTSSY